MDGFCEYYQDSSKRYLRIVFDDLRMQGFNPHSLSDTNSEPNGCYGSSDEVDGAHSTATDPA